MTDTIVFLHRRRIPQVRSRKESVTDVRTSFLGLILRSILSQYVKNKPKCYSLASLIYKNILSYNIYIYIHVYIHMLNKIAPAQTGK